MPYFLFTLYEILHCSPSILHQINRRYVLTAAHCVTSQLGGLPTEVVLGEYEAGKSCDCGRDKHNKEFCMKVTHQRVREPRVV